MKALFNWRYHVITLLLGCGILAVLRAFGEPDADMSSAEFILQVLLSLSAGAACFGLLVYLIKRWERNGKIPEFTDA